MGKPVVEPDQVAMLVRRHFSRATDPVPIAEGEESRTFAFEAPEGAFVLRLNFSPVGFEKDRLAYERFGASDIPIPEVVLDGPTTFGSYFCISRRLEGDTLQALPKGYAYQYGGAIGRLLDSLSHLNTVGFTGFGPFDATGNATCETWAAYLTAPSNWDWRILPSAQHTPVVRRMSEKLSNTAMRLPQRYGVVHGDFGSNNVLVADGRVTGLLDWSEAMIGDPDYDLANILFWRPWLDCMEQQCRYFEVEEPGRLAERHTLLCYQLRIGLGLAYEAAENNDERMAEWALGRCQTILGGL